MLLYSVEKHAMKHICKCPIIELCLIFTHRHSVVSGTAPLIRAAHCDFNADEFVFNRTCNLNAELFMGWSLNLEADRELHLNNVKKKKREKQDMRFAYPLSVLSACYISIRPQPGL